jgi:hypothetical protein
MDKQLIFQIEGGPTIRLVPLKFHPLAFMDLVNALNSRNNLYNLRVDASLIGTYEAGELVESEEYVWMDLPMNFARSLPVYALVDGGWLPPPFVFPKQFFFDRNVIGHIQAINRGHSSANLDDVSFWLTMMESSDVFISPLLFAFESNLRRPPNLEEFKQSYEEAVPIIKTFFPNATVPTYTDEGYTDLYRLVEDVLARQDQETEYLMRAAPMIRQNVAPDDRRRVAGQLFELAGQVGIGYFSVPFLATISCLYEDYAVTPYNAARRLLKLGGGDYTRETAYNALSDIRGLIIYFAFRASVKDETHEPYAYCTADKPALLFACGLNAFDDQFRDGRLQLSISLRGPLFDAIPEADRMDFVEKIRGSVTPSANF